MTQPAEPAITVLDGLKFPDAACPRASSCGLDLWLSPVAQHWVKTTLNARVITLSVEQGARRAWLVLFLRRLFPGVVLASGYPYSTIIGEVELFWEHIGKIKEALRTAGIGRVEIALSSEESERCLTPRGTQAVAPRYFESLAATRQILRLEDLPDRDKQLEDLFPGKLRWALRKAAKTGAQVDFAGAADVRIAQDIYWRTMSEKKAPVYYAAARFRIIVDELAPIKCGALYLGRIGGVPAGMAAVIDSRQTRHLIQVAVPREFQYSRLSDLLVATAIRDAVLAEKKYFDFMATPKGDSTLAQFKEKWGAKSEAITHAVIPIKPLRSLAIDFARSLSRYLAFLHG